MTEKIDRKKRAAIWLSLIMILACGASFLTAFMRKSYSVSTYFFIAAVVVLFGVIILIQKKHNTIAFFAGVAVIFLELGILQNLERTGISFFTSTIVIVVGVTYAVLLLPSKYISRGMIVSIILGTVTCCIDYWGLETRTVADSSLEKIYMYFAMLIAGASLFFILRSWNEIDFSTKMIETLFCATLLAITAIQVNIVFNHSLFSQNILNITQTSETNTIEALVRTYNQKITLLGSIGITIASFFGLLVASQTTKPLRHMVKEVDIVVDTGDLNRNILVDSKDEIGQLSLALQRLMGYITEKANTAVRLSRGDLTENVQTLSESDTLGMAFKQMLTNLNQALSQVVENAQSLTVTSNQLELTAETSGTATLQIAETIQQIARGISQETESVNRTSQSVEQMARAIEGVAKGAEDQSQAVNNTSEATARINTDIEQVINGINVVSQNTIEAEKNAFEGNKVVQTNLEGMSAIKNQVNLSTQKVEEMGQLSNNIGMIVETISEIAEQTNLVALNAAIEAARAGEAGKGFAVVADEVRKLAERSSLATKEIGDLVKNIQNSVGDAVAAMHESTDHVERGVNYSNSASQALAQIMESIRKVNEQAEIVLSTARSMREEAGELTGSVERVSAVVEENTAATEEMAAGSDEIVQAIENISSVSEENSAAVEEVSASTEEISSQAKEVTDLAHSAAAIAKSLNEAVSVFQLAG